VVLSDQAAAWRADSALVLVKYQDYDAGDNFQYYDPADARPAFRFTETQIPLLLAGWHTNGRPVCTLYSSAAGW